MTKQEFPLVPPNKLVLLFPLFIGVVLPAAFLITMAFVLHDPREWVLAATAALLLPVIAGALALFVHRRRVELSDQGLLLRRWPWPRMERHSDLALDQARIINLDDHPELRPTFKIAGTQLPGYRSGLFWLRDRRRAYVLLTDTRRVLHLPKRDGTLILLSPLRPEALLEALQRRRG
ncbi:MAG: PH domain-containing protein [Arenimonas sp.]|jgi:hypothetical protein